MHGEIAVANETAVLFTPEGELAGQGPAIKIVGRQPESSAAITPACGFSVNEPADRSREQRMPVVFRAIEKTQRGNGDIGKAQRSKAIEQGDAGIEGGGD